MRHPRQVMAGVPGIGRLFAVVVVILIGAGVAAIFHLEGISQSRAYLFAAALLLAFGLFASTSGISVPEARSSLWLIVTAVTLGVLAKAAIIAAFMYVFFGELRYVILGVVVAQIDPLSVAAIRRRSGMSPRAQTILSAWASFDDPMTALITVYLVSWLLPREGTVPGAGLAGADSVVIQAALNCALAAAAYLAWRGTGGRGGHDVAGPRRLRDYRRLGVQLAVLVGFMLVAAWQFLMLAMAITGLFFRPRLDKLLDGATHVVFWTAVFVVGLIVVDGVRWGPGIVLGLAAFLSQIVVGSLITRRLPRHDRIDLALAHQNGITAIILALLLEPQFPGTAAVVAPAIVVVNLVHSLGNAVWNARRAAASPV